MGELHLDVLVDRMVREFSVAANVGKPQVAYRETITVPVEKIEERYIRQTGGRGQYGHVVISLEPTGPGGGYEFVDKITGGVIPREYIPAVDAGIQEAMEGGVLAGYPLVDIRAILTYGSYHDVDSSEMAFKIAGSMALKKGVRQAKPVLLEPIMAVEVVTPEDYMGDVIGDLSSRRGRVEGMEQRGTSHVVRCQVPLAEMFGYATDLRSRTQGRATYTMQFDSYQQVPGVDRRGNHQASTRRITAHRSVQIRSKDSHGEGEVRADEAAPQHRHDRSHRPRQDHADCRDHEGAGGSRPRAQHLLRVRRDRQGAGGEGPRHHDLDHARRVRDAEPPLRARRLSRPRRLHQEHDHGCRADGRRDPRGRRHRRPDAPDA